MQAVVRVSLTMLLVSYLPGCAPAEPAAAPSQPAAAGSESAEREQRELEARRLRLQTQLLSELRKLREARQASTSGAEPARPDSEPAASEDKLLVFGGQSHEVFLGCLCEETDRDSVFNLAGEYGSDLSTTSLRNKFAPYGSDADDTSTCNPAARRPPLVVTSAGKSLGLLTMNQSLKRRIDAPSLSDWLTRMCAQ
jgi:hypothetical protein